MANFGIGNSSWINLIPEYELEGFWTCEIFDNDIKGVGKTNSIMVSNYMPLGFDSYIQSVSIPQLSLDYDSTNFGLMNFKEKSPYDDVTLNFYDDVYGSCLGFFSDWLHTIYDEKNISLKPNWRYETKRIEVKYFKLFSDNIKTITQYNMVKCLPKSISEVSTDEEGGDRKTFSVTIATQKVYTSTQKTKDDKYKIENITI